MDEFSCNARIKDNEDMSILDNLEAFLEHEEQEVQSGYSTGKWSDDDDFGITPFLGPNR
jgi:hypothetical protein